MENCREQGSLRIKRYTTTFYITNCLHAGKRGKVCEELTIQCPAYCSASQAACDVEHNMALKLVDLTTWEQAKQFAEMAKALVGVTVHFGWEKSIRVQPIGFLKISLGNANYIAGIGYEDFSAADLTDQVNCPRWISMSNQKKADFKKVYDFAKAHQEKLNGPEVTMAAFTKLVYEATGVQGHYYCAD